MKPRHELKHMINYSDYFIMQSRLKHVMRLDKYANETGEYKIRSLYFDNYNDKALQEKMTGISKREKFRIRIYNNDDSLIKLEKKMKERGLCTKVSCLLSREESKHLINGNINFIDLSGRPLLQELKEKMKEERLRPKTVVDYNREAYIYPTGNVRVTFDKGIRTGIASVDFLNSTMPTVESLKNSMMVLEVKYDEFLPELITDLLQIGERNKTAISKYALCRIYG